MFTIDQARRLLNSAELYFAPDDDEQYLVLNMNDCWAWGRRDTEVVPDDQLQPLAELFYRYGYCGVLYWVSRQNNNCRSEFHDINRFIDFVAAEEAIRAELPDSSDRAYAKRQYTIGVQMQD